MVPVHRATARDRPYYRRPGKPTHPCIVGAGLAPALPRCTRSFIRQQSLKAYPATLHHPQPYGIGISHTMIESHAEIVVDPIPLTCYYNAN